MPAEIKGVILAAGYGTRLQPITWVRAKPAVPFLNRPLIHYSLDLFHQVGIRDVAVNLHYLPETVEAALRGRPERIHPSFEPQILGTAGALRHLRDFLGDGTFFVSNGKIYFEQDLAPALEFHRRSGALATLLLRPTRPNDPFDPVYVDSTGTLVGFARTGDPPAGMGGSAPSASGIYTGVQILEPELLESIPAGFADSITDVFRPLIARGAPLKAYFCSGFWCESSNPRRYLENSLEVASRLSRSAPSKPGLAAGPKAVIVGNSVTIPASARLENCVVWDEVRLGEGCRLHNCVVVSDTVVPQGAVIENAVILPAALEAIQTIPDHVERNGTCLIWPLGPD